MLVALRVLGVRGLELIGQADTDILEDIQHALALHDALAAGEGTGSSLTAGEGTAARTDFRFVAFRQTGDEVVGVGQLSSVDAFFIGGIQFAVANVFFYGAGKQVGVL